MKVSEAALKKYIKSTIRENMFGDVSKQWTRQSCKKVLEYVLEFSQNLRDDPTMYNLKELLHEFYNDTRILMNDRGITSSEQFVEHFIKTKLNRLNVDADGNIKLGKTGDTSIAQKMLSYAVNKPIKLRDLLDKYGASMES